MNYDNQLSSISTQYSKFSKGQYVEHTQFNELLEFFEDQDRLSRVMLQGVGVVCGFEPKLIYTNKKATGVSLSQGVAITTDGDLLTLNKKSNIKKVSEDLYVSESKTISFEGKQYTHWKPYDNKKALYDPFYKNGDEDQIELWELSTKDEAKSGFQTLASFDNLEDKCLLLYLETYEKAVKPCRGVDCDDHGDWLIQNLKVLVTTVAGAEQLLMKDNVAPHPGFLSIEEKKIKRVILTPANGSLVSLKQAYENVLTVSNYGLMFNNLDVISSIMNIPLVNKANFNNTLNLLSGQNENFQYCYAVLKDLTDTYAEIIKGLRKSFSKSLPDLESFPKHVLLGKLVTETELDYTRHQFYNSPILDNEKMAQVRLLIERFNQQVLEFKDPSAIAAENGIKITPSQDISLLGDKAIPFYYNLTQNFLDTWNFDKTRNRDAYSNLSYDTSILSEISHVQNPIKYNLDKKSFYRIEGHQGVNYIDAARSINVIRNQEQLDFDVVTLSLQELRGNKDASKAYFKNYVAKHPSLEHWGGVKRGGTFIIVYESETSPNVIADFALSYTCCSPKSDVALSLPVTEICRDSAPVMFNITPLKGVVKADVADESIGTGVVKINGQYFFNPQLVGSALLDKQIGFTVDGKPTNCVVKVLSDLNVNVYVRNIVYPPAGTSNTVVTFAVTNQNIEAYEYKWDFFGNGRYVSFKPDSQGNVKYTYSQIDATKPVNVLISGNGCSENITLTDWYKPETIEKVGPVIASLTADTASSYVPEGRAVLNSFITEGSVPVNSYQWTCADSTVSFTAPTSQLTGVNFQTAGTYTITLTVRDGNNLTDTKDISVVVGTKASISGVTISPQGPTVGDTVTAQAAVSNPSGISGLTFDWYLNDQFYEATSSNTCVFENISIGEQKIEVKMSSSLNNNHLSDLKSVLFTVSERAKGGTSFIYGTLISVPGGGKKAIETLKINDEVMSSNGTVETVVSITTYTIEEDIYTLNEENVFITGTHPVLTKGGWMSFEPARTKAMIPSLETVGQLQTGVTLVKENNVEVPLLKATSIKRSDRFINIGVSRSKVFYANGYCVYSETEG